MCGRYTLRQSPNALALAAGVLLEEPPLPRPRYNIAPTQEAIVLRRRDDGGHELAQLRWGLVPSWSRGPDSGYSMINARAETVTSKPAFRAAFRQRRCLVPADGFYEWQRQGARKQPYLIELAHAEVFAFAGLWERWHPPQGDHTVESFAIIVTTANETVRPIHDRMPVIIEATDYGMWLDAGPAMTESVATLLRPFPAERMVARAVSKRVNNPRNDDAGCIEPAGSPQ
jgi:putative SOS response-associated peptidase YedK